MTLGEGRLLVPRSDGTGGSIFYAMSLVEARLLVPRSDGIGGVVDCAMPLGEGRLLVPRSDGTGGSDGIGCSKPGKGGRQLNQK